MVIFNNLKYIKYTNCQYILYTQNFYSLINIITKSYYVNVYISCNRCVHI